MLLKSLLFIVILTQVRGEDWALPDQRGCPDCSLVRCLQSLEEDDCPEGSYLAQNKILGCCPACIRYGEYNDACPGYDKTSNLINFEGTDTENTNYYPDNFIRGTVELPCSRVDIINYATQENVTIPERVYSIQWETSRRNKEKKVVVITSAMCSPLLRCLSTSGYPVCTEPVKPDNKADCINYPCTCKKIDFRLWEKAEDCGVRYWDPSCHAEYGIYSPVQIKTKADFRWCAAPNGDKIYGKEKTSMKDSQINCACSRKQWQLRQQKKSLDGAFLIESRLDVSLHCDMKGNYEELQCDRERCWCISPTTGKATSMVLPETLLHLLPCHYRNADKMGDQYLRKCESRTVGIQRTKQILRMRGTTWNIMEDLTCDPDGGFSKLYCEPEGSQCRCVTSTGAQITNTYEIPSVSKSPDVCSCARDKQEGLSNIKCDEYGRYFTLQAGDTTERCIHPEDGWQVSGTVPDPSHKQTAGTNGQRACCLDSSKMNFNFGFVSPKETETTYQCRVFVPDSADQPDLDQKGSCDNNEDNCRKELRSCEDSAVYFHTR